MDTHENSEPGQPLAVPLSDQLGKSLMEQLLAFCEWERTHNPHPEGKPQVAEWAAGEIKRLRAALVNKSRRVCGTESDCVLQPHCSHAQKCMRPEWDAKAERQLKRRP